MNKRTIKFIIITAGIFLSAVFYIFSGEGGGLLEQEEPVFLGEESGANGTREASRDSDRTSASGTDQSAASGAGLGSDQAGTSEPGQAGTTAPDQADALTARTDAAAASTSASLTQLLEEEEGREALEKLVRDAVREELMEICREGYLETALQKAAEEAAAEAERKKDLVNLNTADAAGLMTLEGIGAKRAGDIIAYREANGDFERVEDLKKVSGIKESLYSKICDKICV